MSATRCAIEWSIRKEARGMPGRKRSAQRAPASDLIQLDVEKVHWHLRRIGMSKSRFATHIEISRRTFEKTLTGRPVTQRTAKRIADGFKVEVAELLRAPVTESPCGSYRFPEHPEYQIVAESISPLVRTSNGLFMRSCRMQHRQLPDEFARGKFYDLLGVPDHLRKAMVDQLTRHPVVCRQLRDCAQIADNLSVVEVANGNGWWVIDRWISGSSITTFLEAGPIPQDLLGTIARELVRALHCLHEQQVILRELAPHRVFVDSSNNGVVITDLELAKLVSGGVTVSSNWPTDAYRAPEIEGGKARPQSDFFSWGRIVFHAAAGRLPDPGPIGSQVTKLMLPKAVSLALEASLSVNWKNRPRSAADIMTAISQWN
jgi:hypothetical protein